MPPAPSGAMEGSGDDGGGEDVALRPRPSHEGDSSPSDGDEGHGEAKVSSKSPSAVPKGCEAVGSTVQQETWDHVPSCAKREGLCSEPGTGRAGMDPDGIRAGKTVEQEWPQAHISTVMVLPRAIAGRCVSGRRR